MPSWRWGSRHGQAGEKGLYSCACPWDLRQLRPCLPGAGALPVGGRAGRVYTLEAASGVEAHLARPTLDAIFLTFVDVWAVGDGWIEHGRGGPGKAVGKAEPRGETLPDTSASPRGVACRDFLLSRVGFRPRTAQGHTSYLLGGVWSDPGWLTLAVLPAGEEAVAGGAEAPEATLCVLAGVLTQAPHAALIKVWSRWGQRDAESDCRGGHVL